ncbi:MAG: dienelactone hydrolase family protein [Nitrososphaerota archaeon]|nr:dienelactone hydrolase family protein [Nitrososphaerota archaeon]MDG6967492.1 dienelactone hydrolase family protein [Nitrososphaerota archaeon]MDG6978963.1 dienelactone hydrolase family protein [Nitrososphaerota archaeon]MDG7022704.1 dienelactone hydrolase family protein [Nitrososphaerota archaeon]
MDSYSAYLPGELAVPEGANDLVIFAHGSGSSRLSPRNAEVARVLHDARIGTLLFDLLTEKEDQVYDNRFDIDLLAERLTGATRWVQSHAPRQMRMGFFGASTGAAAALQASTRLPEVAAVVSRGGRPDLAWGYLGEVTAPTLLIVGGRDEDVLELNRRALGRLSLGEGEKKLVVVPGATHLFEEAGALETVAGEARDWFARFLARGR